MKIPLSFYHWSHTRHPHYHRDTMITTMTPEVIVDDTTLAKSYPLHVEKHHVFNYANKAHDHNEYHIMGERDNHIATCISLSPGEGLLPPHRGSNGVDGDGPGGRSLSRQGAGIGPSEPPKLVGDGGGALYRIWENPSGVRVFSPGVIYRPKGIARGSPRGAGGRRPRPTYHPRGRAAPALWASPRVALLVQFREYFQK